MVFPRARAVVAAVLFLAWLGFLLALVLQSRNPIILSRPQFLVATLVVVAEVEEANGRPAPRVTISDVAWSADPASPSTGAALDVANLPDLRPGSGYRGPGAYILPLWKEDHGYALARVPPAPGLLPGDVRLYPLTPQTRAQLDQIVAGKGD